MKNYIGIDIGSTSAKTVVMDGDKKILHRIIQPTGWSSVDTAEDIRAKLSELGFELSVCPVVATGYGRVSVPYADKCVTEISCHGKGACYLHGQGELIVIDIGGQDTKIISVCGGIVSDFIMNDKCSAGTGRFLEIMSNILSVKTSQLCQMAARGAGVSISSMCTVFAESEVISLIGRGEKRENIAFAVVDSIVKKVSAQMGRMGVSGRKACLTGGLCDMDYICQQLSRELKTQVEACGDGRYAGAIGAALCAMGVEK